MRFVRVFCLVALLAGVLAGAAAALDFNDEGDNAPRGEVGKVYHFEMPSHGGCFYAPYRYVVESGQLPPGTKLGNASNLVGLVSGIPTESGTFGAWIALKDVCGSSAELLFTFDVWPRRWGISTDSLKPAVAGSQYSFTIEGKGVPSTVTWAVTGGALPAGITLSQDGKLAGTPTTGGAATFTVTGTAVGTDPAADGNTHRLEEVHARRHRAACDPNLQESRGVGSSFPHGPQRHRGSGPYAWAATGLPRAWP